MKTAVLRKHAEYFEQVLPEYRGNPLIEVLPDILSSEDVKRLLRRRATHHDAERSMQAKYRIHCLARLAREYYQPLPQHFSIEKKISVCIRQGYPEDRKEKDDAGTAHDRSDPFQ